jgi:O-antigen ligase
VSTVGAALVGRRHSAGLLAGLGVLLPILHLAHATGLRNTLAAAIAGWAAMLLARSRVNPPLRMVAGAWLTITAASALWSPDWTVTLKSVLYDVAIPLGVFYAAYFVARLRGSSTSIYVAMALGMAFLSTITLFAYIHGQSAMLITRAPTGFAYYYPGSGVASTLALYALPCALLMVSDADRSARWTGYVSIACILGVGLGSSNRMFWLALVAVVAVYALWQWWSFSVRRRLLLSLALAVCVLVAIVASMHLSVVRGPYEDAGNDRLNLWDTWSQLASDAPLLGYGFGKRVISKAGGERVAEILVTRDSDRLSHAHNLLINVLLQAGVVGLAVFLLLLGSLLRCAFRPLDTAGVRIGGALAALVAAMLAKNMTDDLMDNAVVVAFWLYAGHFLGRLAPESQDYLSASR